MVSSAARIADLKQNRELMCINLDEKTDSVQHELFGTFDSDESQRIEVRLLPCDKSSPQCALQRSKNDSLSNRDIETLWEKVAAIEVAQLYRDSTLDIDQTEEPLINETYLKQNYVDKYRSSRQLHKLHLN